MPTTAAAAAARVDGDRLNADLEDLAAFGRSPDGAINRLVFTEPELQARRWLVDRMRSAGLQVRIDPIGNLFGRLEGIDPSVPPVLTGSHIDSTLNAGRFDGTVGVLAALEALRVLGDLPERPRRPLEMVAFTSEEPTRFGLGVMGSTAMVAGLTPADAERLRDWEGVSLAEALRAAGLHPELLAEVRRPAGAFHAFLELHIEQGPYLERTGKTVGIVTAIAGPTNLRVTFGGSATHAGSTPMADRRDALLGACEVALAVEAAALGTASKTTVGTVGSLQVFPGAVNVIPGRVVFTIDLRDHEPDAKAQAMAAARRAIAEASGRRRLEATVDTLLDLEPAPMDPAICTVLREACNALAVPCQDMVSAAYHDALNMARIAPTAMLFIPSRDGISHNPAEWTDPVHIRDGARVLAAALARLAAT